MYRVRRCLSSCFAGSTPSEMISLMHSNKLHRGYLVLDSGSNSLIPSHPLFAPLADTLSEDSRDFHLHEGIFFEIGARSGALMVATVHKTKRGQAAGGVRLWKYATVSDMLKDGLRLSRGMGRKNALAGLWWGGGKGNIAKGDHRFDSAEFRRDLFQDYGGFMSSLRGCYVTAEDAGVTPPDLANVFRETRFTTCIPVEKGGSGNPSVTTGLGVVCAMEGAIDWLKQGDTLEGKTVAIQGSGNVARYMTGYLLERNIGKVLMADIDEVALGIAGDRFKKEISSGKVELRKVDSRDSKILFEDADIVAPCALGGTLNQETIPHIKAKIICGAANNQLLDDQVHDKLIQTHGKIYVPDFLANRMGIVNCANEQYGYINNDESILRHFGREWENSIFVKTQQVLNVADQQGITSAQAADRVADELSEVPHPIWGHRSWGIIQSLIEDRWEQLPRF